MKENDLVYEALRNSIISCEERIRNETTSMYVIFFTMYSLGFTYNWLFLVSCIALISFQAMINADRLSIEKASAYIRIFFEECRNDIHWESLHKDIIHLSVYNAEIRNIGWYFDRYSSATLAIFSFLSLAFSILKTYDITKIPVDATVQLVITLGLMIAVLFMNRKVYINNGETTDNITVSIQEFYLKCMNKSNPINESKELGD